MLKQMAHDTALLFRPGEGWDLYHWRIAFGVYAVGLMAAILGLGALYDRLAALYALYKCLD
ncbi:MAG TPA: hypothetical protein VHP58_00275 [Alphaproteobacteria bacterium]|nr:hypothetical protein [Alphaproteobacteria bacterium]